MDLNALRHSTSHIMAQAVQELYPGTKLGIGPSIENGFYYDFDRAEPFTPEDLMKIEEKMRQIILKDLRFDRKEIGKAEAKGLFGKMGEDYKLELIDGIEDNKVSIYTQGGVVDICKGPHISSTSEVQAFKLLSIAGAYWRGDEDNKMLQRIYGTAFEKEEELQEYLKLLEEAKLRDHRKLGVYLDYFSMHDEIGAGLVLYHPKGALLRHIIEDFEKREHLKRGYQMVISPHIMKSDIWVQSGHYEYYKEHMYLFEIEGKEYAIKPMNCPGHILVYKSKTRSYRDLPLRYFELGNVYRHEKSGVLHGLLRVRGFTQDDAHIFCAKEDLINEIKKVIEFVIWTMKVFGFGNFEVEISTRPEKYIGSEEDWNRATEALESSLKEEGISYAINEGDGAFYGPKIDIKLKDAIGRSWQCATIQCDFALPERFDLKYAAQDGTLSRPIMLHRVLLGSMERFIGALLEHYAGALPLWLAPVQVIVLPITSKTQAYALHVRKILEEKDIRVELDDRNEKIGFKIREAQLQKVPYMLIIGEKEAKESSVSVRMRSGGDQGAMELDRFMERVTLEIKDRK
ncbi:MAG: threonine--tRNA ligase [Candidatus Omnitrophica bacterium]|nr:threonine--tRNA ligase [Candidatus Omnitrophota bacterium]